MIKGSPEQEAKERQAAEEKARRQAAAGRKPAGAPRSATPGDVRVRELAGQFDNPDEGVRLKAAIDLSRCTGDAAVSALVRGLKDSSPKVRGCSAESLRMLRNPAAVDALVEVLMNDPQHDPVYYATKALGALATPKAIEGMISALKQRKGDISELALQLGEVRAIGAVEALLDALGDNDRERVSAYARRHAVMALQKIGDRRAVPALRSALNDGDAGVRERAQRALEALGA
ncbi:MAG: HEAT repeat domain-containing protein [Bryobacteraceae bacterium]